MFRTTAPRKPKPWSEVLDQWNPGPYLNPPDRYDVWEHNRKKILDFLNLRYPTHVSMDLFVGLVNEGRLLHSYPLRNELIWAEVPKPKSQPTVAPTPVEKQAQAVVDDIRKSMERELKERIAWGNTGRVNWAEPGSPAANLSAEE